MWPRACHRSDYDYLVLALGAVVNFHGTPGAAEHSYPLYTMVDAIRLHDHILKTFEAVDKNPALVGRRRLSRFASSAADRPAPSWPARCRSCCTPSWRRTIPNLPIDKVRIILYEHSPHLLAPFKPKLRDYAQKTLEERGIEVHTGVGVKEVGPSEITLASGEKVKTQTLVWAAGLAANPVATSLGIELGPGGRIPVNENLQIKIIARSLRHRRHRFRHGCQNGQTAARSWRRCPPSRPLRWQNDRAAHCRRTGKAL